MTARQQRRQAERKARKQARKTQPSSTAAVPSSAPAEPLDWSPEDPAGFEPQKPTRAEINRANAQHSTGPRTPEGKAVSSRNNFRHGLAGNFAVLDWEDAERYTELLFQLHQEHQPATMTETLLVERMAQHQWLSQRAVYLQNYCFHMDVPHCEQEKDLALYLRYQTTHDRAFHKCLSDLLKLRAQRTKEQHGFESQQRKQAEETRKQELHAAKLQALKTKKSKPQPPLAAPILTTQPAPAGFVPQTDAAHSSEPMANAA